ncbi:hypothetical protein H6P81_006495 [Aristolochia fimbriata]|uniref:BUB1 N-terminal domain-containing protein n=1 Tax=Aristolochia fimbriata TaxID=158543 RepID=A0AAV7EYP5_ARIFI|nr:hypothetical protein H6P81_006495 [Aristolochia fimbriata]
MADDVSTTNFFSSLIAEIKAYSGNDPLLPWLHGIKKMRESLPPQLLKEKLPRFLQKCACTFEDDGRYRNDSRYLRVWIQLMDFVEDPKGLLKRMEANQIGLKRALFYQAYALYYEKLKRFEMSEQVYHLGVQNLAEPVGDLHKSYEQFLRRVEQYKKRKAKKQAMRASMASEVVTSNHEEMNIVLNGRKRNIGAGFPTVEVTECRTSAESSEAVQEKSMQYISTKNENFESRRAFLSTQVDIRLNSCKSQTIKASSDQQNSNRELEKQTSVCGDDTVVVKFVGSAIVGKSEEAEDACHHGLVDPTINTKEVMSAINNMFMEPLDIDPKIKRRSQRSQPKVNKPASKSFEVFIDENLDGVGNHKQNARKGMVQFESLKRSPENMPHNYHQESLMIFVDSEDENDANSKSASSSDRSSGGANNEVIKDDTVICRFVRSTVCGESDVENACHHGLVDPTVNLKEALDDINSMFGKPLDYVEINKRRKPRKPLNQEQVAGGFVIFTDDNEEEKPSDCMKKNKLNKLPNQLNEKQEISGFQIFSDSNFQVKPSDFVKTDELQKQHSIVNEKQDCSGFVIFTDDDMVEKQKQKVESSSFLQSAREHNIDNEKQDYGGFVIFTDDDMVDKQKQKVESSSIQSARECDLFEPTLFTKEAIDDINEMFSKPLSF